MEIRRPGGERFGMFLDDGTYATVSGGWYGMQAYSVPKGGRLLVGGIMGRYRRLLQGTDTMARYDGCRSVSVVLPLNKCMLGPGRRTVTVVFYVKAAQPCVFPVFYYVSKGWDGWASVSRDVPPWMEMPYAGTDGDGMIYVRNGRTVAPVTDKTDDAGAVRLLDEIIPGWTGMTDAERMRTLDGYIGGR